MVGNTFVLRTQLNAIESVIYWFASPQRILWHILSQRSEVDKKDQEKTEGKEVWRKSDSNMSFNTIRPGATTVGNRTSRPVYMAESLHSTHTIVPVNKRLSALVTDADFAMAEESDQDAVTSSAPVSGKASPSGSDKSRNRQSASLVLSSRSLELERQHWQVQTLLMTNQSPGLDCLRRVLVYLHHWQIGKRQH